MKTGKTTPGHWAVQVDVAGAHGHRPGVAVMHRRALG